MQKNYDFSTKTLTGGKDGIKFLFFHLKMVNKRIMIETCRLWNQWIKKKWAPFKLVAMGKPLSWDRRNYSMQQPSHNQTISLLFLHQQIIRILLFCIHHCMQWVHEIISHETGRTRSLKISRCNKHTTFV